MRASSDAAPAQSVKNVVTAAEGAITEKPSEPSLSLESKPSRIGVIETCLVIEEQTGTKTDPTEKATGALSELEHCNCVLLSADDRESRSERYFCPLTLANREDIYPNKCRGLSIEKRVLSTDRESLPLRMGLRTLLLLGDHRVSCALPGVWSHPQLEPSAPFYPGAELCIPVVPPDGLVWKG
jgi:hypothetical protein